MASTPQVTSDAAIVTLEGFQQHARKTTEIQPRVAVYDIIAAAKGRDNKYASGLFLRYLQEGKVPPCEEVEAGLISGESGNQDFGHGGGSRKKVLVATAEEMIQIMWALPGETTFKQRCADVIVRFLGGDPNLMEGVLANRAEQERLEREEPDNAMRSEARGSTSLGEMLASAMERGLSGETALMTVCQPSVR